MKTRIMEPHGTWYWEAVTENRSFEWNPAAENHRQCFSWTWKTNLKKDCSTCKLRVDCLSVPQSKCSLVLETRITLSEITGMVDEYEGFKRFPYEVNE